MSSKRYSCVLPYLATATFLARKDMLFYVTRDNVLHPTGVI